MDEATGKMNESPRFEFIVRFGDEKVCLDWDDRESEYVLRVVHLRGERGYEVARLAESSDAADLLMKHVRRRIVNWRDGNWRDGLRS